MKPILNANAITRALWAAPQRARTAFTSVVGAFSARGESTDSKVGFGNQAARFAARTVVTVAKTTTAAGRLAILGATSRFKLGVTAVAGGKAYAATVSTLKRITSQAAPRFGVRGSTTGLVAPAINNAPVWNSAANATFTLARGATLDLRGSPYFTDADGNPLTMALVSGALPAGVTFNNGVFTASGSATLGSAGPFVVSADDGVADQAITTFTLTTTAASGTYPFTLGQGFAQGAVQPGAIACVGTAGYQVRVTRLWNDGSVKHAIISGRAALTQNVARSITITNGATVSGTALTRTQLEAGLGTAGQNVIDCAAFGSVDLSTILSTGFVRQWIAGPEMIECHYRADIGTSQMSAWFHVRYFADGRRWIRAIVENGYLDNGSGGAWAGVNRSYVPTITVGGAVAYNNGGASRIHYKLMRYYAEAWTGGNPEVTATHDVAYLRSTKLVPNYAYGAADAATLNAQTQTYTVGSNGAYSANMGDTGFAPHIGLLTNWEAMYFASGDARALRAIVAHTGHLNSYGLCFRRRASGTLQHRPIRPADFGTWNVGGPAAGGSEVTGTQYSYEINHAPSAGYACYLLTGDYFAYETMAFSAAVSYLMPDWGSGSGESRTVRRQTRGTAWILRNIGQFCALAEDADLTTGSIGESYRNLLSFNYTGYQNITINTPTASGVPYGSLWQWGYKNNDWGTVGAIAPWMTDFWVAVNGHLSDAEPLTNMTALNAVRDWMYRWPVGRLGVSGDTNSYNFANATGYGMEVATDTTGVTWWSSWGEIYFRTNGVNNTVASNTLVGGNIGTLGGAQSYWGNLIPAIAYAVEHNAAGASAAWARLTGATNWSTTLPANFPNNPVWGVRPRNV